MRKKSQGRQRHAPSPPKKARQGASRSPPRSESLPNIKRIVSKNTCGWQVHVRRSGILKTKLFSDRLLGGKNRARDTAIAYRELLLKNMAHLEKPLWKIKREPRSNTGHLGVSYTEYTDKSGKLRRNITATVRSTRGKAVSRKFSVDRYGYDAAVNKAVTWRKNVLRERAQRESSS